jgi:hypothetical protein
MPGANILKCRMKVETLRIRLFKTAETKGLDHPETIRLSQRVDQALNQFEQARKAG